MNLSTLTTEGGGPRFAELRERRDTALAARKAARDAHAAQAVAMAERDRLRRELVEAHADGSARAIKKAEAAIAHHDETITREAIKTEGLALAAERREGEVRRFIGTEVDGLLAEHGGRAEEARRRLVEALHALDGAVTEWSEAARVTQDLVSTAGRAIELRTATLPPQVANLAREASRIDPEAIPRPLPEGPAPTGTFYFPPSAPGEDDAPVGRAVFTRA